MILAALAAAAGLARGISGIVSAHKQGVQDRTLIKRAYRISNRRMNEAQAYARQDTNESLNARGVLNGGSNTGMSPTVADAVAAGVAGNKTRADLTAAKGIGNKLKVLRRNQGFVQGSEQGSMAADSERGQTGDASTLSGQVNSDLSREFYGEHQDLASQRDQLLTGSRRAQSAATVGAIGAGINVGTQVYSAGQMIRGAYGAQGAQAPIPGTPAAVTQQQPIRPGNWFGGYDPVDPLGLSRQKLTNDQFNVHS